jgi:ribose/xylose/arabinose/galactoside ABC-type transport system permease subunit
MSTSSTTPLEPTPKVTKAATAVPSGRLSKLAPTLKRNGLLIFFAFLLVVFTIARPEFLSQANIRNILLSASVIGILALGQTVVILTGGFDIGIAKTAVLAGMVVALTAGMGPAALLVGIAATIVIGLVNGILISRTKVNPFIVTLGMYTILTSVALLSNDGGSVINLPPWLLGLVSWQFLGMPGIVWWFAFIAVITHVALAYTRWGGHIYAVGGNEEAARLAGIKSSNVLASAYVVAAVVGGLAGVMLTSRLGTASPVALPGAELDSIAAVVIGGTKLSGGFGSIPRTIVGILILMALQSGLVLMGVNPYYQGMFKGAILILAVAVDVIFGKKK